MRFALIVGLILLFPALARSQQFDRLVRGKPVTDPEAISGRWVAPDGRGGWLELAVEISARLPVGGSLVSGPFLLAGVQVEVCRGLSLTMQPGQCNYFMDDPDGDVRIGRSFLQIHKAAEFEFVGVDVDLTRDGDAWTGMLHRGDVSGQVRLERGGGRGLTGTWQSIPVRECLHIGERQEGILASLDQLQDPRTIRYANGIQPAPLLQIFGRFITAERDPSGLLRFDIVTPGAGRTIQLRPLTGRRSDGRTMVLTGRLRRDPPSMDSKWVRVEAASCRATLASTDAVSARRRRSRVECETGCAAR